MSSDYQATGKNKLALFSLKVHRGDGMALIAMNWKKGKPPLEFVGFAIEYKEPGGDRFFALKNRLAFPGAGGGVNPNKLSTWFSPIQKFRWVHFPRNAELDGDFTYKVTPVFMNSLGELSRGEAQQVAIELRRETYPKRLNVTFTRGFVSSQAFVDKYGAEAVPRLLPAKADEGLNFVPSHPKAQEALTWMGFEARSAILELLDEVIADKKAQVRAVMYDLNEPGIVSRFEQLGARLKIIIDDNDKHGLATSGETLAAARLAASAGAANVKRQHMGKLQHNKTIVVDGPKVKAALCGSTNHSWRGFFVQNNNAIVLRGKKVVKLFNAAFEDYWVNENSAETFGKSTSAVWQPLGVSGVRAQIGFSPRSKKNAVLKKIADDISKNTVSSLFFSLAFLYQTPGAVLDAINKVKKDKRVFSYGISDHKVAGLAEETEGIDVQKPDGTVTLVAPAALTTHVPEPFKSEPVGGSGNRMHHKFVVIDFDKPTARVYMGSYNFSGAADVSNGENLLLINNRRIAVSYVVEALRIFDHYHFRLTQQEASEARRTLQLELPPRAPGEKAWWEEHYTDKRKIRDRELFA
jgi:phosphatidylserine/phosphatidylglycerophosphate/cardiolipin synthase-like enzyme